MTSNKITMALPLLLLLLSLTPLSHSEVFVSIDCGSDSESYNDANSITWMGDGTLILEGEPHAVEDSTTVPRQLSTLRAFTAGSRNKYCYAIAVEKDEKVLIRAGFYYGNYDGRSSPPTFALLADGNRWATVSFNSAQEVAWYEAIYVAKADSISVCVAQTEADQFPFISALELRSVASNMYSHVDSNYALLTRQMVAYGANSSIRYPFDAYDRIWDPEPIDHGYTKLRSDALSIDINVAGNPPEAVLRNAVASSSTSEPLILSTQITGSDEVEVYVNMYMSEVARLGPAEKREFVLTIDNEIASAEPIVPPYEGVIQLSLFNTSASSKTTFALVATNASTLPPLINAMEVFIVAGPLAQGTNALDWEGLATLQEGFSALQEWSGDPCLPSPFTWDWVNCSSDDTPRITALYLGGFGLDGPIPDFSALEALETIDMHNNSLTGSIPDFLGNLPNLKQLNLADNKLSGSIPTSLSKKENLELDTSGNSVLCASNKSPSCSKKNKSTNSSLSGSFERNSSDKLAIILGAIVLSFFVFF